MNNCVAWEFANDGHALVIKADLVKGWRCEKRTGEGQRKTYCFSELINVPWQGGRIKAQVSVFPRPGGLEAEWRNPPLLKWDGQRPRKSILYFDPETYESDLEEWDDCCVIKFAEGSLNVSIDIFNADGMWHEGFRPRENAAGCRMFEHIADYPTIGLNCPYASIDLQVRLTFVFPNKPTPIERSFWNEFLAGGRPESNRRKF